MIIAAGFFSQRIINIRLGSELVGLNGVISNVINVFSVTELGFSTAIVFHLYRALAEGREKHIAELMNLYRKAYYCIAAAIMTLGLGFLPFVHFFLKTDHFTLSYVRLIYILWLLRTVLGYLLSYKRSIIIADQKEYISSLAVMILNIVNYVSIIVIVALTDNYILALISNILFEMLVNILLILYVDRTYSYLRTYRRLKVEEGLVRNVFGDVKNLFVTRIAQRLLISTDNLILSSFINLGIVGFYSNYCLITQSLVNILRALANALQPSVGAVMVDENEERDKDLLQVISFLFFFLAAIVMSGVANMSSIFVGDIWLGRGFLLSDPTVFLCALNCMLNIMSVPIEIFVNVSGLFQFDKKVAVAGAVVNLAVSLILVRPIGIDGVLAGTAAAYLVLFTGKTIGFYRLHLRKSMLGYLARMSAYGLLAVLETVLAGYLVGKVYQGWNFGLFLLALIISAGIPAAINFLVFWKSPVFGKAMEMIRQYTRNTGSKK